MLATLIAGPPATATFVGAYLAGPLLGGVAATWRRSGAVRSGAALALGAGLVAAVVYLITAGHLAPRPLLAGASRGAVSYAGAAALAALAVRSLWRSGLAGWVAALHGHHEHHPADRGGHHHH